MNDAAAFAGYVKKGRGHMNDAAAFAGYVKKGRRHMNHSGFCRLLSRKGEDI